MVERTTPQSIVSPERQHNAVYLAAVVEDLPHLGTGADRAAQIAVMVEQTIEQDLDRFARPGTSPPGKSIGT